MASGVSAGQKLRDLIASGETILMPGVDSPLGARLIRGLGFKACLCAGWLTGAHLACPEPVLTMTEQIAVAGRVAQAVDIPVISDGHTGGGEVPQVMRTVQAFEQAGIAMFHIEDQVFPKRASYHRGLEHVTELDEFLLKMEFALKARKGDVMIFARTDAGNAVNTKSWKEAARRARALKKLGVDGLLPMCRTKENMEKFRQEYPDNDLPLLATTYFNGMPTEEIRRYGFQLIAYPLASTIVCADALIKLYTGILKEGGVAKFDVTQAKAAREEVENAIGLPELWKIEEQTVEAAHRDWEGRQVAGYEGYDQKRQ